MKAKLTMSVLAALSLTVVATAGRPAGVPPQPTRPVVAPPTEHPPVVTVPPVQAPPVDIPSPPEAAAGQPPANHPPFSISDLQALLAAWGACDEGLSCEWDLNQDGVVGPKDLTKLVRHLE